MKMNEFEMKYIPIYKGKESSERLEKLNDEDLGKVVRNLIRHLHGEDIIEYDNELLNYLTEDHIRRYEVARNYCVSRSENGKKGGRPKSTEKHTETTENHTKAHESIQKPYETYERRKTKDGRRKTETKRPYGECANVYLTEEEHSKIVNEGLTGLIEELSLYIASKGDKYKSHYAVIKQWALRRKREQAEKEKPKSNQFTQGVMSRDIDFTDLEKKLIKN